MKLLLTIVTVVLYACATAQGPAMSKKDFRINEGIDRLIRALDLSKEQADKLRDIESMYADKLVSLNLSKPGSEAKANELKEVLASREAEIKKLFTAGQFQKYLEMREAVLKSMNERRMKRMAGKKQ